MFEQWTPSKVVLEVGFQYRAGSLHYMDIIKQQRRKEKINLIETYWEGSIEHKIHLSSGLVEWLPQNLNLRHDKLKY